MVAASRNDGDILIQNLIDDFQNDTTITFDNGIQKRETSRLDISLHWYIYRNNYTEDKVPPENLVKGWIAFFFTAKEKKTFKNLIKLFIDTYLEEHCGVEFDTHDSYPLDDNHYLVQNFEIIKFLNEVMKFDGIFINVDPYSIDDIFDSYFNIYYNKWIWEDNDFVDVIKIAFLIHHNVVDIQLRIIY